MKTKPIFLISLPRSGSTFLQRLLGLSEDIETCPETWLLLSLIYNDRNSVSSISNEDRLLGLKNVREKSSNYKYLLKDFINSLYNDMGNGKKYFLDKTPRYYLIIDQILEYFPDAKIILLLRNPVYTFNSMFNTWGPFMHGNKLDLEIGFESISQHISNPQILTVCYDKIIQNPQSELDKITSFLDIKSIHIPNEIPTLKSKLGDKNQLLNIKKNPKSLTLSYQRKLQLRNIIATLPNNIRHIIGNEELNRGYKSIRISYIQTLKDIPIIFIEKLFCFCHINLLLGRFRRKLKNIYLS